MTATKKMTHAPQPSKATVSNPLPGRKPSKAFFTALDAVAAIKTFIGAKKK